MDQSDPGLPQPWPAHCSQGTEGRHLRGWTLGGGSYTSCFGTCSNSVARPRSSPANHDKSCLGVLSGQPPVRLPRLLGTRGPLHPIVRGRRRRRALEKARGARLPRGLHVWRCGCYGLLQEAQGFDDVLSGGDGTGRTWMANMMAYQFKPYRSSARWCQSGSPPTARLAVEAQRSAAPPKGSPWAVARCDADDCRPRVGTCSVPLAPTIHARMSRGVPD